jgi:hypothetical protein
MRCSAFRHTLFIIHPAVPLVSRRSDFVFLVNV